MAGTFLLGERKTRPGVYYRRERRGYTVEGATNGILAVIFQSNWGALNKVVDIAPTDLNNLGDIFGEGNGVDAIREGLLGGATTVRAVRVGGDDGVCATVTLQSPGTTTTENGEVTLEVGEEDVTRVLEATADEDSIIVTNAGDVLTLGEDYTVVRNDLGVSVTITGVEDGRGSVTITYTRTITTSPTNAVEISAKYPGTKSFTASVRTHLVTGKRQLLIYDGKVIFQAISFDAGGDEAQALFDAMATNRYFTATKIAAGVLADVTQASLTGGVDPTVTNESYEKGTNVLERFRWNCIIADTDNTDVRAILYNFVTLSYETGYLGFACIAGKSTEDFETRMSYAASINDEKVVYVLNGWIGNDGTVYDGWRAAARIGGMIAGCESNVSLTHDVISNALELIEPLTNGEIIRAEQKGCLVLSLNSDAQVQVDNAINTLVTAGSDMDEGWKKIRRTKTRFELMDRINRTHDRLVGFVNNDTNGRATIIAAAQKVINEMVAENKLVFGSYVEEDPGHPAEGDSAWFLLHILDLDSLEKIYLTYIFRYNQTFDEE